MVNWKQTLTYVITGTLFTILYAELIAVYLTGNPIFTNSPYAITVYYILVTFIFSLFIFKVKPLWAVFTFFIYGIIVETFLFRNITGPLGVFFFGNQYISIFGVPYLITKRILRKGNK